MKQFFDSQLKTAFQTANFESSQFKAIREKPTKAAKVNKQHKRIAANDFIMNEVQKALSSEPNSRIKVRLYKSEAHRKAARRAAAIKAQKAHNKKRK